MQVVVNTKERKEAFGDLYGIFFEDINHAADGGLYAELIRRTVVYHMKDGKTVESVYIRTNFDDAIKALTEDERFIRCGKSLLVNMHHIVEIGSETIGFDNDSKISAGRKLCREVHNAWVRFSFSEEENI